LEEWVIDRINELAIRAASLKATNIETVDRPEPDFLRQAAAELESFRSEMDFLLRLVEEVLLPTNPWGSQRAVRPFILQPSFHSLRGDQQNRVNRIFVQAEPSLSIPR
jgi:uncharacterized protein YnzC (UPF0291/DUF896 family)